MPLKHQAVQKAGMASSLASARHMAGHETAARNLQEKIGLLVQENDKLLCEFVNVVDESKLRDSEGRLLHMKKESNCDILTGPSPASVMLQGEDGGTGHAIAIFENCIVDASWPQALPRTRESLDWCCSPSAFFQPFRVCVLKIRGSLKNDAGRLERQNKWSNSDACLWFHSPMSFVSAGSVMRDWTRFCSSGGDFVSLVLQKGNATDLILRKMKLCLRCDRRCNGLVVSTGFATPS